MKCNSNIDYVHVVLWQLYFLIGNIKEDPFEKDQRQLSTILSKGVHVLHPEVLNHLIMTASKAYDSDKSWTVEISIADMWSENTYSDIIDKKTNLTSTFRTISSSRGYENECTPSVKASSFSPFQFMAFSAITISTIINIVNAINNNNNNNDNNNNNNLVSFYLLWHNRWIFHVFF